MRTNKLSLSTALMIAVAAIVGIGIRLAPDREWSEQTDAIAPVPDSRPVTASHERSPSNNSLVVQVPGYAFPHVLKSDDASGVAYLVAVELGSDVEGVVVDADSGAPIPDARIWSDSGDETLTDLSGSYLLNGVATIVSVEAEGYAPTLETVAFGVWADSQNAPVRLDISLSKGLTVAGRVVNARGQALPRARVEVVAPAGATSQTNAGGRDWSTMTDEKGRYRLRDLSPRDLYLPGLLAVNVCPWSSGGGVRREIAVDVEAGEFRHDIVLDVEPTSGLVVDASGSPVDSARVTVQSEDEPLHQVTFTDGRGFFEVRDVPAGEYAVTVELDAQPRFVGTLQLPDSDLSIVLPDTVNVDGTVLFDATEGPLAGFLVRLVLSAGPAGAHVDAVTDARGVFSFAAIPPGIYELVVEPPVPPGPTAPHGERLSQLVECRGGGDLGVLYYPAHPCGEVVLRFDPDEQSPYASDVDVTVTRFLRGGFRVPGFSTRSKKLAWKTHGAFRALLRQGTYTFECRGAELDGVARQIVAIVPGETVERRVILPSE